MAYFICKACKEEKEPPGKFVTCLGCGKKRIRICRDCLDTFTGCDEDCKKKHRQHVKSWLNTKISQPEAL